MAKYHENLKYHEDEKAKHKITSEQILFLQKLQNEMNTQDNCSQADPRYWVIKGSERLYHVEEADGYELYNKEAAEVVAENTKDICEYIKDNLLEQICENHGIEYQIYTEESIFGDDHICIKCTDSDGEEYIQELENLDEIQEWLEETGYDEYTVISYKTIPKIYENVMFLTQTDAELHLRANYYHYSEDAHTYAMTAWRSRRVEELIKILQTVDWEECK